MIRIETPDGWTLITHKNHARLAGEFAMAWDTERFVFPEPRASVLLGIAAHDDSWEVPDSQPSLAEDGTPSAFSKELVGSYDAFENIDLAAYLEVRRMATEACADKDPFAARMISMHTVSLLTDHADLSTLSAEQGPIHAAFIEQQRMRQQELTAACRAHPELAGFASEAHFQAAFELLQGCDSLSLYCCALFPESGVLLLGICFLREAPERAIESDRRAGKWGLSRSRYFSTLYRATVKAQARKLVPGS